MNNLKLDKPFIEESTIKPFSLKYSNGSLHLAFTISDLLLYSTIFFIKGSKMQLINKK